LNVFYKNRGLLTIIAFYGIIFKKYSGRYIMNSINDLGALYGKGNPGHSFESFKTYYPQYLDKLNSTIMVLYNTYVLLHNKRFRKLTQNPECLEVAQRIGFGMLLRHSMETLVTSVATENGVEVGGRSVYERLEVLKGQSVAMFDSTKKAVLSRLLDITNEIAHPHVIRTNVQTYNELKKFYTDSFSPVMESHIAYLTDLMQKSKSKDFGITKEAAKSRKLSLKYLSELKKRLDNIDVSDKMTSTLAQGCLVRQLTECTANRWAYNYGIVPSDVSTFENQIKLTDVLESLSSIARTSKRTAFGTSALTMQVITHLHQLRTASNNLMHVEKFAASNLDSHGAQLSKLYDVVKTECSPYAMTGKLDGSETIGKLPEKKKRVREKSPTVAAILCGSMGWLGAHQFYVGKFAKGVAYILFGGFLICPTIDLYKIWRGKFRDSRRFRIGRTPFSSIVAFVLLAAHLFVWYNIGIKIRDEGYIDKIRNFSLIDLFTLKSCEESELENMTVVTPANATSTSYLQTANASFDAMQCIDGYPYTCWQEGVDGNGEGESLTFTFGGTKTISAISILNGKHASEKAYFDNARASRLIIKAGKIPYIINIEDIMKKQTFTFAKPVQTDEITITIESTYAGTQWEDLCISEISFYTQDAPVAP